MYKQNLEEGELDLSELLSALWAIKLITLITSLSVFLRILCDKHSKNSPLAQYLKSLKAIV